MIIICYTVLSLKCEFATSVIFCQTSEVQRKHIVFEREVDYIYIIDFSLVITPKLPLPTGTLLSVHISLSTLCNVQPNLQLYNVLVHTLLIWVQFEDNIHILFYFICKNLWCKYAHYCTVHGWEMAGGEGLPYLGLVLIKICP